MLFIKHSYWSDCDYTLVFFVMYVGQIVNEMLFLFKKLVPHCYGLWDIIKQLLVEDSNFYESITQMLLERHHQCDISTLPAVSKGVIGAMPVLHVEACNPEKWTKVSLPLCNGPCLLSCCVDNNAVELYSDVIINALYMYYRIFVNQYLVLTILTKSYQVLNRENATAIKVVTAKTSQVFHMIKRNAYVKV